MKVIQEKMDGENYIEVILAKKELISLADKKIVTSLFEMNDDIYNIGIRLAIRGEENATNQK